MVGADKRALLTLEGDAVSDKKKKKRIKGVQFIISNSALDIVFTKQRRRRRRDSKGDGERERERECGKKAIESQETRESIHLVAQERYRVQTGVPRIRIRRKERPGNAIILIFILIV